MPLLFFFFLLSLSSLPQSSPNTPTIGVAYSPKSAGLPSASAISTAVRSAGIRHLLLHDPDPTTLRSFLYSPTSLLLALPNSLVPSLAAPNSTAARRWLSAHLLPFQPRLRISALAVGRDLLLSPDLLPAIAAVHSSCSDLGLPRFPISTLLSFNIIDPAFPPSTAKFRANLSKPHLDQLLGHLSATGSSFLIDIHPFELYRTDHNVPIGFAMFEHEKFSYRDDPYTGLRYRNLFDAMADAALTAVARSGHRRLPVMVAGTGWPTGGARAATVDHARRYNRGLVKHLRSGIGTPMRKNGVAAVYVHELFDELGSRGEFEWGIWYRNLSAKYEMEFSGSEGRVLTVVPAAVSCSIWVFFVADRWSLKRETCKN